MSRLMNFLVVDWPMSFAPASLSLTHSWLIVSANSLKHMPANISFVNTLCDAAFARLTTWVLGLHRSAYAEYSILSECTIVLPSAELTLRYDRL